jgi:5'-3' exonuclease
MASRGRGLCIDLIDRATQWLRSRYHCYRMKLHLVDGTFELFRAFHAYSGAGKLVDTNGQPMGAVRGLVQSLLALIRDSNVTHIAVAFDHVQTSFRNDLLPGYKDGAQTPPELLAQFDLAEEAAHALGLTVWPMVEYEADDVLGSAVHRWSTNPDVDQIVVCTLDKDLTQMVQGTRVVCLDRRRGFTVDETSVVAKFGVQPESIPDYLALVGDSSDRIPGIAGWGAKASASLLRRYMHIEAIPERASAWDVRIPNAPTLAAALVAQRDKALLYKNLTTLRLDVPIQETLEQLAWRGVQYSFRPFTEQLRLAIPTPPSPEQLALSL